MSLDKLQHLVNNLAKQIEGSEKIATPILASKLAKFVASYPEDKTLGSMSRVIEKMSENNTTFVTRTELRNLYSKLYSHNTKFAELFSEELGVTVKEPEITTSKRDDATELHTFQYADPVLANALNSVFDNVPLKMYSQELANKAKKSVSNTLDAWSLRPSSLEINDGNEKFIVIKADYDTPKGISSFYVPIEIRDNKIVEASVFMGNSGPQDLNHVNIKKYLTTFAGSKLKISGNNILGVLTKAASENREVSDAEYALAKLNAGKNTQSEFFQGQIIGQKVSEASVKDVELPKLSAFEEFEKKIASTHGIASSKFGKIVEAGMNHISRELADFGHKNAKIAVAKTDDSTIFYSVAVDAGRLGFTVPVKVADGKLIKPNVILCNGSIVDFSQDGISELYVENQTDNKAAAVASSMSDIKPSDLVNNVRAAMEEGNHAMAEDALNVLSQSNDAKAYATAFQIYMNGLVVKTTEPKTTCSMVVKASVSEHALCGHTGLPLHKVYQDEHGNCRPLYRRGMSETYEGASFMNSKIFG